MLLDFPLAFDTIFLLFLETFSLISECRFFVFSLDSLHQPSPHVGVSQRLTVVFSSYCMYFPHELVRGADAVQLLIST